MMTSCGAVILAAGDGVRMKSAYPYVMKKLLSKPMISWVLTAAKKSGIPDIAVVVAKPDGMVAQFVGDECEVFAQPEQKGTAHAATHAKAFIEAHKNGNILILNGDSPLMDAGSIRNALMHHLEAGNDVTVIAARVEKPFGYGRIVRDHNNGNFAGIVEERDASGEVKRINEISSGAYWFKASSLLLGLQNTKPRQNGESNLVDTISWLLGNGKKCDTSSAMSPDVVLGANDRSQLHELNHIARMRELETHLEAGVDIPCFDGVVIDPDVVIGMDTVIYPGTILRGKVVIGKNCKIGPNTIIENSTVGDNVILNNTQCYQSVVKSEANIGPFVHIRPNSVVGEAVHLGNYVEVKNSTIDMGTKVSHLTYVGDSDVGKKVNFGCGTVTVNYTGRAKFRTTIKDNAFIGCNTNLVAPVTVGEGAYTAAGSTITEDVPDDSLGIARARQVNKLDWCLREKK